MTRKEAERQTRQNDILRQLGFTYDEAESLRRISMTLRNWFEHECNGDIQRGEDGIARYHYGRNTNGPFLTVKCVDRETGARKRLAAILDRRNMTFNNKPTGCLSAYIQGDPRGAALYIIRPGDVPAGADVGAYYNRGICVY